MFLRYPEPALADKKVVLRPWADSDLSCVEEASRDPEIPTGTTVPRTYTAAEGLAFIARQHTRLTAGEGLALAIAEAGSKKAIGHINLLRRPQKGVVGIGYWLIESARGCNLGFHAVRLLSQWGLRKVQLDRIEALVEPSNVASVRLLEKVGFKREGLLRSYLAFDTRRADVFIYSFLPSDTPRGMCSKA